MKGTDVFGGCRSKKDKHGSVATVKCDKSRNYFSRRISILLHDILLDQVLGCECIVSPALRVS